MNAREKQLQRGRRWHLSISSTLVLARSANDAGGLDIHAVNAASAASYAQTACKEASPAAQSGRTRGTALFLPVRPTPHARLLLRSQVERKAASAPHADEMIGEAPPPYSTPPH